MTTETLKYIASGYNLSVFRYTLPEVPNGRDYMIEINPGFAEEGPDDKLNMIDARWIDMETGLFIDITSVRPDEAMRQKGLEGALKCKDNHHYQVCLARGWKRRGRRAGRALMGNDSTGKGHIPLAQQHLRGHALQDSIRLRVAARRGIWQGLSYLDRARKVSWPPASPLGSF
jgi:hypothetical protein